MFDTGEKFLPMLLPSVTMVFFGNRTLDKNSLSIASGRHNCDNCFDGSQNRLAAEISLPHCPTFAFFDRFHISRSNAEFYQHEKFRAQMMTDCNYSPLTCGKMEALCQRNMVLSTLVHLVVQF